MNDPAPAAVPKDSLCTRGSGFKLSSKKSRKFFSLIFRRGQYFQFACQFSQIGAFFIRELYLNLIISYFYFQFSIDRSNYFVTGRLLLDY